MYPSYFDENLRQQTQKVRNCAASCSNCSAVLLSQNSVHSLAASENSFDFLGYASEKFEVVAAEIVA